MPNGVGIAQAAGEDLALAARCGRRCSRRRGRDIRPCAIERRILRLAGDAPMRAAARSERKPGAELSRFSAWARSPLQFGWLPQASGIGRLPAWRRRRVCRRRPRRQTGRDRLDVVLGQEAGDDLHAVRRRRGPRAVAPAAELRADVAGAQAEQAGDRRLHAAEASGRGSWRRPECRAADRPCVRSDLAARQDFVADGRAQRAAEAAAAARRNIRPSACR